MRWSKVSLCFHSTTVVVADDQKSFLNNMRLVLDKQVACKFFTHPKELIKYFNTYRSDPFINRCVSVNNDKLDYGSQSLNLRLIRNEIYNKNRFSQISTLITDYAMPGINGLECCEKIQNNYIDKILLTGQADNKLAIEAFNNGIINKFIQKSASNVIDLINENIVDSQIKYFINLSEKLYDMLPDSTKLCLTNPAFANFFYNLCKEKQIVEYYLTDERGSFLMLDSKGKPSWLALANDEQLESYYEMACGDTGVSKSVLNALKSKKMMPYFYTDDDLNVEASEWENYLHPAKQLASNKNFYYAYIHDPNAYKIDQKNIFSYQQFLQSVTK